METYIQVVHYRIPVSLFKSSQHAPKKGRPIYSDLFAYKRGGGWDYEYPKEVGADPLSRGGMTIATIYDKETNEIQAMGEAICSMSDNFNYKLGKAIAVGRCLHAYHNDTT